MWAAPALAALAVLLSACASAPIRRPGGDEPSAAAAPPPARIVTAEGKGQRGGRLVWVDEDGARLGDLTPGEAEVTVDMNPSWSQNGGWVVFSSNRGRKFEESSLWLVAAQVGAEPIRLTQGNAVDRDPRFLPGDRAVVYAAHIGDGSFDLWYLPLRWPDGRSAPPKPGKPRRLTRTPLLHEMAPAPRPDGSGIVYMAIDPASKKSRLYSLALPRGKPVPLTSGPFDATPSVSPDGQTIAFSAAVKGREDLDLHAVDARGKHRRVLIAEPTADESGPVWSADGRYVFATAVVRSAQNGRPLLSSLVFVDLGERRHQLRALHDPLVKENPGAYVPRLGAAVSPAALDARRLHHNWTHRKAADAILTNAVEENQRQQPAPR